jgi:hypothetical protein
MLNTMHPEPGGVEGVLSRGGRGARRYLVVCVVVALDGEGTAHTVRGQEAPSASTHQRCGHRRSPRAGEDAGDVEWMEVEVLVEQRELAAIGVAARDLPPEIIRRMFLTSADGQRDRAPVCTSSPYKSTRRP